LEFIIKFQTKKRHIMFRSRHTIAFAIIVLYFIPIMFLSYYGMSSNPLGKTWSLFSFGLVFAIGGSLTLFLLMMQFENAVSLKKEDEDDEGEDILPKAFLFEDDVSKIALDEIIINLNKDLEDKNYSVQSLAQENNKLASSIKDLEQQIERLHSQAKLSEVKAEAKQPIVPNVSVEPFQSEALDIKTIEESLYQQRDNRVEVTRL